ncbi:MAG: hypothetical protein LBR25_04715 [Erysipelotrichaceae bacterium]|jgi:hypothetical protein|nr:hypothetical protein [Erysipelotrichaceae bacterium]
MSSFVLKTIMSTQLKKRVFFTFLFGLGYFFLVAALSYYLLPDGFLLQKNNATMGWDALTNPFGEMVLILAYNSFSYIVLVLLNQYPYPYRKPFFTISFLVMFTLLTWQGITIGTFSFTQAVYFVPDLTTRLFRNFDLLHRAALWELCGQLMFLASTARSAIAKEEDGQLSFFKAFKQFKLSKAEKLALISAVLMVIVAAIVEGMAIFKGV